VNPCAPSIGSCSPNAFVDALTERGLLRRQQASDAIKRLAVGYLRQGRAFDGVRAELSRAAKSVIDEVASAGVELALVEDVVAADATRRLLYRTPDQQLIETVIIPSEGGSSAGRSTLCVSSQVGCGRRCVFCETGRLGLVRQLSADEIVAQFRQANLLWQRVRGPAPPLTNVVFMGMGEPLDNLEAVLASIEVLTHDWAFGLATRRITVSTVGVADKIGAFLGATKANLAVSLNAPDDQRRSRLMPVNRRCGLAELKESLLDALRPGRDVLFEYVLFDGVNDRLEDARLLCRWLDGLPARLNLIPANPGPDPDLRQPSRERVLAFQRFMLDAGIRTMVRYPHGRQVGGACGQLAGARRDAEAV